MTAKPDIFHRRNFLAAIGTIAAWLLALKSRAAHAFGHNLLSFWTRRSSAPANLYTWGMGFTGALGQGDTNGRSSPTILGSLTGWAQASGAYDHTLAIHSNGTLWAWGTQFSTAGTGVLGTGNNTAYSSPVQVGTLSAWTKVATGYYHTLAIQTNGTLWAWGRNTDPADGYEYGPLGLGNSINYSSPVQVGGDTNWASISCGQFWSVAIKTNGTLWAWGYSPFGNLGLGNTNSYSSPVQVGSLTSWSKVCAFPGGLATLGLQSNGTLWAWGMNGATGELGVGDTSHRSSPTQIGSLTTWSDMSIGSNIAFGIQNSGTLWAWGNNSAGQLGNGGIPPFTPNSPIQIGTLTSWRNICSGMQHAIATQANGTLWSWGTNTSGVLGHGDTANRNSPVQVGSDTGWKLPSSMHHHAAAIR